METKHNKPLTPKKDDTQQVLKILKALKQASHDLQNVPSNDNNKKTSSIKALLELGHGSTSILSNDPYLTTLSTHLSSLKTLIQHPCNDHRYIHHSSSSSVGLKSFLVRKVNSHEISRVAGCIESEIQAWIDREFIETLTRTIRVAEAKEDVLIHLIQEFEERISKGFDSELQDCILRSKVFNELEMIVCDGGKYSGQVREAAAFAIAELIKFNKDVFVGYVLMGKMVGSLVSLSSARSVQILGKLINRIKSPIIDEIVSNGDIPRIISFLSSEDLMVQTMAMDCVLEIGYFGRKEAIDAMLEQDLVKKLVDLQKLEIRGRGENKDGDHQRRVHPFAGCVARFAVQLEVGEGLRKREKRELKQVVLKRVRELAHVSDAEAATIIAEVLWGASP